MLDLNYQPQAVVDKAAISQEEWLEYHRMGIGGSDCAAVFQHSPFKTATDLYWEKVGKKPLDVEEDKWFTLEYGKALEPLIGQLFARKTGFQVDADTIMCRHPLFPYLIGDRDFRLTLPDGTESGLEVKTTDPFLRGSWDPRTGKFPLAYEYQVRLYMAVWNLSSWYIACLYGKTGKDLVWLRVDRDYEKEKRLILGCGQFWFRHVVAGVVPKRTGQVRLELEGLRKWNAGTNVPVLLDNPCGETAEQYCALVEQIKALTVQERALKAQMDTLRVALLEALNGAEYGRAAAPDGGIYEVGRKAGSRVTVDTDLLRAQYPEAYRAVVQEDETFGRLTVRHVTGNAAHRPDWL